MVSLWPVCGVKSTKAIESDNMLKLRSDKVAGAITGVLGICLAAFASFGLLMVALQRFMFSRMPRMPPDSNGIAMEDWFQATHGIWMIYMPLMIVGGLVLAVAGFYVWR